MHREIVSPKIVRIEFDVHLLPASLFVPREAGLHHFGVRSAYVGTANWLNFVPLTRRSPAAAGARAGVEAVKVEFFLSLNCTQQLVL